MDEFGKRDAMRNIKPMTTSTNTEHITRLSNDEPAPPSRFQMGIFVTRTSSFA